MSITTTKLAAGDEVCCLHCGQWHSLAHGHLQGTPYSQDMLFFTCRGASYYGGQLGAPSRFATRRSAQRADAQITT